MISPANGDAVAIDITGYDLNIEQVIAVARRGAKVTISPIVTQRMEAARQILDEAIERGERIYGATTSVGPKTSADINQANVAEFSRRLLFTHNVGHGPLAGQEIVRATILILLNAMASGRSGVRPIIVTVLLEALNHNRQIDVHLWGSMGQSDMSSMADLALALFDEVELAAGEALALLNSSAFATAMAVLSFEELYGLLHFSTLIASVSMEGYAANPSTVSNIALLSRPFDGLHAHGSAINNYLEGSYILRPDGPRNLQDPLCFRSMPIIHGAAEDSFAFCRSQIERELNASQGNPVISIEHRKLVAVANFDMVTLSMALDVMRLAMSPVITSSTERVAKLVDAAWSGLAIGLVDEDGIGAPGFNGVALFHKSIASEARLLTTSVTNELASSSHSNGVMDRASLAALGARRGAELAVLSWSIFSMELLVACQAVQLRGRTPIGKVTDQLLEFVRQVTPFAAAGQRPPNVQPLLDHLRNNAAVIKKLIKTN